MNPSIHTRWANAGFWLMAIILFHLPAQAAPKSGVVRSAAAVQQVGTIAAAGLTESSGIVISGTDTNLFWTHNDGPSPILFGINRQGSDVARFTIHGASVTDWEDIARDGASHLYLADIGNNDAKRTELAVYRLPEPKVGETAGRLQVERSWRLRFPSEPFDCESLFIWKDHAYVISKVFKNARAAIYRFDLAGGSSEQTLQKIAELQVTSPVTAADISPDGSRIALIAKNGAYLFQIDGDVSRAGQVKPSFAKFREGQIEGCCFVPEGLLTVSEKREVFLFPEGAFVPAAE